MRENRRNGLLDAASELLVKKPNATLAEVAEYAQIGVATLYRYFATRDALILALGYRAIEMSEQALAASDLETGTVQAGLIRAMEALVMLGDKVYFLLTEQILEVDPQFVKAQERVFHPLYFLLVRGQKNGEIRNDLSAEWMVQVLAFTLFAAWDAVLKGTLARREAPRLVIETLLHGFAGKNLSELSESHPPSG